MTPEQAAAKYKWISYDPSTNVIEMYLDHHMLSTSRQCESKFALEHLAHIKPKYTLPTGVTDKVIRKPWFLDFGEWIHYALDEFYTHWKVHHQPPVISTWLEVAKSRWDTMKMDDYKNSFNPKDVDSYNDVGGWEGVAGLLVEYYASYIGLRVRVVDTEICFGYNKEVFIGEFFLDRTWLHAINNEHTTEGNYHIVKCYLTGRIDLIVDNGYKIGPVDHKTTKRFDGYEHLDFNPHDGITGYVLAVNEILKRYRDAGLTNLPISGGGWMYHISTNRPATTDRKGKAKTNIGPRFKVTPIEKNDQQLIDYKARNLSTFKRIAELIFNDKVPEWNTGICNNIFFRRCEFAALHDQPSNEWNNILRDHYEVNTNPWDTRNLAKNEKK